MRKYISHILDLLKYKYYRKCVFSKCHNIDIGQNLKLRGKINFKAVSTSQISICDNVTFNNFTNQNFVGLFKRSSIYVGENATLSIGSNSDFLVCQYTIVKR